MKSSVFMNMGVDKLELQQGTVNVLINNNIKIINDLWNTSRKNLKRIGLNDEQINQIIIKLQLMGIDLNKKIYNKD